MKRIVLRIDDISAHTRAAGLVTIYDSCWERGIPVCLSVIPQSAYRFDATGPVACPPMNIHENSELVALLDEHIRAGRVEIALHGWQHHPGEWADDSPDVIRARLLSGLNALRRAWPDAPVRVVVPPHDHLSFAGWQTIRALELGMSSSWAATLGGAQWAHWWAQSRHWRGLKVAPAVKGLWPTDSDLLDFAGPECDDWPETKRLLKQIGQWDAQFALVQHYWRLLDDDGVPNARYDRWLRWLDRVASESDVRFERYSDG